MRYSIFFIILVCSYLNCFAITNTLQALPSPLLAHKTNTLTVTEESIIFFAGSSMALWHYKFIQLLCRIKQQDFIVTPGVVSLVLGQSVLAGFFWYQFAQFIREKWPDLGEKAYCAASLPTLLALIRAIPAKQPSISTLSTHVV